VDWDVRLSISCLDVVIDDVAAAALYNAIYNYVLNNESVSELTVEDPAEAFEDLRDRNDLRMLLNLHAFIDEGFGVGSEGGPVRNKKGKGIISRGKMGPPVEKGWAENWRVRLKIAGVSFDDLKLQLSLTPSSSVSSNV
jgi:histone acetyltransferase 1